MIKVRRKLVDKSTGAITISESNLSCLGCLVNDYTAIKAIISTLGDVTFIDKPNGFNAYLVNPDGSSQLIAEYRVIQFDITD
jgi:hypothetical protein